MSYLQTTTENLSTLPGRIAYAVGVGYLYVVGVFGDKVLGVHCESDGESWKTENKSVPLSSVESQWSYGLDDFQAWTEPLAQHFQQSPTEPQNGASEGLTEADVESRVRVAVRERENALRAEFEQWKRRATEIAHQYADDNSLCREFDRCMREIGLEPRSREFEVEVQITYSTTITVEASDDESAAEMVSEDLWSYLDTYDVKYSADVEILSVEDSL